MRLLPGYDDNLSASAGAGEPSHGDGSGPAQGLPAPWPPWSAGDLLALALLLFWAGFMLLRIRYGFDAFDEGMYLSATDRLVRGDIPFRDDQENPLSAFNVVLAVIERPWGGCGLIAARAVGALMQLAQMAALWAAVRRCAGPWTAALAACLVPCVPLFGIWTPGYNELSCTAMVTGGVLLALASAGGRVSASVLGLGAGVAFGVGALSYAPMAALAVVPMAMAAWGWWRTRRQGPLPAGPGMALDVGCFRAGSAAVSAMAGVWGLATAAILGAGLGADWWAAVHTMVRVQDDALPLSQRLATVLATWSAPGCHLAVLAVGLALVRVLAGRAHAGGWHGVLAGIIVLALLAFVARDPLAHVLAVPRPVTGLGIGLWIIDLWYQVAVVGLGLVLVFTAPAVASAWRRGGAGGPAGWGIALAVFVLAMAVNAMASSTGGFNGLNLRAAVLAMGAGGMGIFLRGIPRAAARPLAAAAIAAQAGIAVAVGCAGWSLTYKDDPPSACTATFTRAPLAGVHSTPGHVVPLTALQAWVDAHEPADARCIAYHEAPALYFVLGRRPALARTWVSPWWSWQSPERSYALLGDLLATMRDHGRRADFCVRQLIQDHEPWPYAYCLADPLHAYVLENFRPVWRAWPYEVLVPRGAAPPDPEPEVVADPCGTAPFDPTAQVIVAPGADLRPDGAGGLWLSVPGIDRTAVACQLLLHGADEVSLRLRIDCEDPDLFVLLARDQQFAIAGGRAQGGVPGWDVTFPAGPEGDRGFALGLTASASTAIRRVHIRSLCLERFPPPADAAGTPAAPP